MGIAAVTILVQGAISFVLFLASIYGWHFAWIQFKRAEGLLAINRSLEETCGRYLSQISEYDEVNTRLRSQVQQLPLAPKPKPENPFKHPRTSGDVRRMTEQAWGGKPDATH
jgi:hypothetical protein